MLPDFSELRKQSCGHTDPQPLKPRPSDGFSKLKSSQQFEKPRDDAAFPGNYIPLSEAERAFFDLWVAQPSWSPIIKDQRGWQTIVNHSGKKVPLVLGTVESYYRRGLILGKRFGKLTNYLLIDVDINSPFHPRNGGIKPILAAMESLGLCRYLLIRSSESGGIHIYFPLAEPVSSWGLACAAHAALTAANVKVFGGICELFPNQKAFNAEHNGHRLPLQAGSCLLDSDFSCIGNSKAAFLQQWQHCTAGQDEARLADLLVEKPLPVPHRISVDTLPPIRWTAAGQSNEVMKKLVNYGDHALGLNTIQSLGDWIATVAPQLPGFTQFASEESKHDLTRRNWAYRWTKSHFKSVRLYAAKTSFDHNATVAAEALERLLVALDKVVIVGKLRIKHLWQSLSDISRQLFGVGFSWKLFQKHRKLIMEKVGSPRNLGLSSGLRKDENLLFSELVSAIDSENSKEPERGITQLRTARSVTPTQNANLDASPTPSEQEKSEGSDGAELAMGTAVIFQQPGNAVEGVQTRVTGKTTAPDGTPLYRLEECAEGKALMVTQDYLTVIANESGPRMAGTVIRATAAQLLQILGPACPFVGPGLWEIRRDEVPAKAWGQLLRLVGEG